MKKFAGCSSTVPMEILHKGRTLIGLQVLLVIFVVWISTVTGQDGFLSIDCGSDHDYRDNVTGIYWETDAKYISTGRNINGIVVRSDDGSAIPNFAQSANLRFFDDPRSRDCYVLPVEPGETYLLRASFFYGSLGNGSTTIYVLVSIDNNLVFNNYWDSSTILFQSIAFEMIYSAPRNMSNFCLIRSGSPTFISALELRKLNKSMYAKALGPGTPVSQYLFVYPNGRINAGLIQEGPIQFVRFPDDMYDRIWQSWLPGGTIVSNANIANSSDFSQDPDQPPLVVMQDAVVYYNYTSAGIQYGGASGLLYLATYFQELDGNASAANVRGMDFFINDVYQSSFNVSAEPKEFSTIFNNTSVDQSLNLSYTQSNWSRLSPMINAFELYFILGFNLSTTVDEDVSALLAVQVRLNLMDWTGDPCLPAGYAYDWLNCSDDVRPRITRLLLANHGFGGNLPLEIGSLTALTDLYLENNSLTGAIPSFLGTFPNLTRLALDNNNFSGTVPSDLNKQGLILTISNNPGLIIPAWLTKSNSTSSSSSGSSSGTIIGAVVGGILGGLLVLAVATGIVWLLCTRKSRATSNIIRVMENAENRNQSADSNKSRIPLQGSTTVLSLQEVSDATNLFSKKIGEGSFGPVYYGKLPNGQEVAVKVKSADSRQGANEFSNEVELLSRIHHRNLVSLVGYCEEGSQQILIYVYVSNGTLRQHLYGDKARRALDWRTRVDIALNAARGLEYLHTDCNPRIIHRDVKSSNILIDDNMVAKVADFGISKQAPEGVFTGVDTLLKGTPGYFDPEYFLTQRLTQKSDVYSFGIVLLEIITGRHPHVSDFPDGTSNTLIQWVRKAANNGSLVDIVDPSLNGQFNEESMMKVISVAVQSTDNTTANRPDMKQVVRSLTEAIELELYCEIIPKTGDDTDVSIAEEKDEDPQVADFGTVSLPGTEASTILPR